MSERVHGYCAIGVIRDPDEIERSNSPMGKPFLQITFAEADGSETVVCMTTKLAEMIGATAKGVAARGS